MGRVLYIGLKPPEGLVCDHVPLIAIHEVQTECDSLEGYNVLIFTSQTAVELFCQNFGKIDIDKIYAVGPSTAAAVASHLHLEPMVPIEFTAEGLVSLLEETLDKQNDAIFWPHAAGSRPILSNYFKENNIPFRECILYETKTNSAKVDLMLFSEVHFTSPSTVTAFFELFGPPPEHLDLIAIGPITAEKLKQLLGEGFKRVKLQSADLLDDRVGNRID